MSKRALIVDDSRSARVILSRMLEGYSLAVDSAESAEQALEYLKQARPDVIFMDHLMPGMDGFQAIQAIKSNPDTAMIPVMMYTSQEGELYLSQARALGAVGVLPKTVKQADVSRVLYQLRLLPERRDRSQMQPGSVVDEVAAALPAENIKPPAGELETAIRNAVTPLLKEHGNEMRRLVLAALEAFAKRLSEARIATNAAAPAEPQPAVDATPPAEPAPASRQWPWAAIIASLALLSTLVLAVQYMRTLDTTAALMQSNAALAAVVQEQQAQVAQLQQTIQAHAAERAAAAASPATADSSLKPEVVPYGEAPLAGTRVERLRLLLGELKASKFHGKIKVATYIGDFCLTGNGIEGYSIAADDLPVKRCDLVGNPFEDGLTAAQRQSLAFANLIASVKQDTADALTVEIQHEGRRPSAHYPEGEQLTKATAGEWNKIAAENNRVEFATLPAGT
jgi:CheY-like chemotaxis protein